MRETLIVNGINERLPDLLGNAGSTFSLQASSNENFKRVCSALLGDSGIGKIMAGLNTSVNGNNVGVGTGYGICVNGDLVKLVSTFTTTHSLSTVNGAQVHVYLNYVSVMRGQDNGGHSSYTNFTNTSEPIIRDNIGSYSSDPSTGLIYTSSTATPPADVDGEKKWIYLGYAQYVDNAGSTVFTSASAPDPVIDYVVTKAFTSRLWTGATTMNTGFAFDSKTLVPVGKKRLHQLQVLRKTPATDASARSDPSYLIRLMPVGFDVFGNRIALTDVSKMMVLSDNRLNDAVDLFPNAFSPQNTTVDIMIDPSIVRIGLEATCTTSVFTTSTGNNGESCGSCEVEYVIQMLN